ncbi:hypothetical protein C3L33_06319, partial [Rhododendron williamsianum]
MKLSEDVIQKILKGSCVLEILELYDVYGFNRLHVSNASVKKLIVRDFWEQEKEYQIYGGHHALLEISAPHLHSLEILGVSVHKMFRVGNVSSLVDAILSFNVMIYSYGPDDYDWYPTMLKELLQSLVHVKKITLGNWAIQYFSDKVCNFDGKHYWTSRKKPFTCLMFRLQKVKFIGFGQHEVDYYLSFVQFILENARCFKRWSSLREWKAITGKRNLPKQLKSY